MQNPEQFSLIIGETVMTVQAVYFTPSDVHMQTVARLVPELIPANVDLRSYTRDIPLFTGEHNLTLSIRPGEKDSRAVLFLNATQETIDAYWRYARDF